MEGPEGVLVTGGQVENEYGFCQLHDVPYLRHLVSLVRDSLGSNVIVYTTDPPNKIKWGTIKGSEVYSCAPPTPCSFSFLPTSPLLPAVQVPTDLCGVCACVRGCACASVRVDAQ